MSKITVLRNDVETPAGKKYQVCNLGYRTDDGKVKGMRIFGFGDQKGNFDVAKGAQLNDILEAQFRQNDKGYWEFASLTQTGEKQATSTSNNPVVNSSTRSGNWETSEERAARQEYIIRQSSISSAIAFFEGTKTKTVEDVLKVAEQFRNYVFQKPTGEIE